MQTMQLTDADCVASLGSQICPACGNAKERAHTFCGGDYHALPFPLKKALYRRVGKGYREAVIAALRYHDVEEPAIEETRKAER